MTETLDHSDVPRGHPRALYMLFFAELWERFCYYGMRALLALYVVAQFGKPQDQASLAYGAYTALVYATGIFGGFVADRVLGFRRAILLGGVIMAAGEFALLIPDETAFLFGLSGIVVGCGLFKPNISSLVGKLYQQGDPRRDGAFTIFYMGINIGALLAPLACVWVSYLMGTPQFGPDGITPILNDAGEQIVTPDYRWGFGMAGAGMLLGMLVFWLGGGLLEGKGGTPEGVKGFKPFLLTLLGSVVAIPAIFFMLSNKQLAGQILIVMSIVIVAYLLLSNFKLVPSNEERWSHVLCDRIGLQRTLALVVLLLANSLFWACFEQAGNSLNFFAKDHVGKQGFFEFEWFQSVNSSYIILLAPVFAWLWVFLDRVRRNPSIPSKFGLGLIQVGLGFGVALLAIEMFDSRSTDMFVALFLVYLLHTTGELCVSPVGLSMVTKLAPAHMTGFVMGAWFLSISMGNFVAGIFSAMAAAGAPEGEGAPLESYYAAYNSITWTAVGVGALLLVFAKPVNKLMHGIK